MPRHSTQVNGSRSAKPNMLESAVGETDYASLARCAQYAHFTPGYVIRAIWAGLQ
ncbi:hypothetical protein ACVJBD_007727 [Rhizobium mongolense]